MTVEPVMAWGLAKARRLRVPCGLVTVKGLAMPGEPGLLEMVL